MVKEELIKRSPLRIFEKSIHGGLKAGELGVLASRQGVGKTACLVHLATDKLFQGKHVIHVSFSARIDHIMSWYEDIFSEIAKLRNLEDAVDVHDEIIKNRVIMNFNRDGVSIEGILRSLKAMIEDGHFNADTILFDGFVFDEERAEDLERIRVFAQEEGLNVWFSSTLHRETLDKAVSGIPLEIQPAADKLDVIITLIHNGDHVQFTLAKDRNEKPAEDMHLKLDPKTLLIAEEQE